MYKNVFAEKNVHDYVLKYVHNKTSAVGLIVGVVRIIEIFVFADVYNLDCYILIGKYLFYANAIAVLNYPYTLLAMMKANCVAHQMLHFKHKYVFY